MERQFLTLFPDREEEQEMSTTTQDSKKYCYGMAAAALAAALALSGGIAKELTADPLPPQEREAAKLTYVQDNVRSQIRSQFGAGKVLTENRDAINALSARIAEDAQGEPGKLTLTVTIDGAKALSRAEEHVDGTGRVFGFSVGAIFMAFASGNMFLKGRQAPPARPGGSKPFPA
jgi:hypothetical protein